MKPVLTPEMARWLSQFTGIGLRELLALVGQAGGATDGADPLAIPVADPGGAGSAGGPPPLDPAAGLRREHEREQEAERRLEEHGHSAVMPHEPLPTLRIEPGLGLPVPGLLGGHRGQRGQQQGGAPPAAPAAGPASSGSGPVGGSQGSGTGGGARGTGRQPSSGAGGAPVGPAGRQVEPIPGFTPTEAAVIEETRAALRSPEFKALQELARTGQEGTVRIAGRTVFYIPGLPARHSGMTMTSPEFGDEGFIMGPDALASPEETAKTFLHEIYRLRMGQRASGAPGPEVAGYTQDAHAFADRAYGALKP